MNTHPKMSQYMNKQKYCGSMSANHSCVHRHYILDNYGILRMFRPMGNDDPSSKCICCKYDSDAHAEASGHCLVPCDDEDHKEERLLTFSTELFKLCEINAVGVIVMVELTPLGLKRCYGGALHMISANAC